VPATEANEELRRGLRREAARKLADAAQAVLAAQSGEQRGGSIADRIRVTSEPLTYERNAPQSFIRDLYFAREGDLEAQQRLARHMAEMEVEHRDLDSTDTTGGDFVAPIYLMDEWIPLARAGRPWANAVRGLALPPNTDSINIPKVSTGTATATQTDNNAVQDTDPATATVTVPVRTIAGQVDLARQLFDRGLPGMDTVLFGDLAADYATKLDVQCLNGSGNAPNAKGVLNDSAAIAVTYDDGSPGPTGLYSKIADAIQQIHTSRFMSPTAIVMHPRRWAWFLASYDSQGRPLVLPQDVSLNGLALVDRVGAENVVGRLQGLPVILDASIPITLGDGNNEDAVVISRVSDVYLWEEATPRTRIYEEVKSGTLEIRLQVFGYFAFTTERYSKASAVITGTGLVTPSF
jgi:HK97 family phage major capsid protein